MNSSMSTSGKTKIKIVLLGNQGVGKSCIIERYVKDHFDQTHNPTVGIDFLVKNVTHHAKSYRIQLWDTAGQERFRALIPNYLKDAKCALIIFDVASRSSLNNAELWLKLFYDNRTSEDYAFAFLIGNKIDLEYREVEKEQAQKKAEELHIPYFQVSAKSGQNIQQLFKKLIDVSQKNSTNGIIFEPQRKQNEMIQQEQKAKQQDVSQQKQSKENYQKVIAIQPKNQTEIIINPVDTKKFVLEKERIIDPKNQIKKNKDCC